MTRRSRTVAAVVEGPKSHTVLCELHSQVEEVRGPLANLSPSCANIAYTPPAATGSRTRSMPGCSRDASLCPGSFASSRTS
jgi:hypothetical protein